MADQPVGWLATTVTLYDELEKDIRRAFTSIHQAVGKVQIRFPDSQLHQDIAKSVAVLQILLQQNFPPFHYSQNTSDSTRPFHPVLRSLAAPSSTPPGRSGAANYGGILVHRAPDPMKNPVAHKILLGA